MSPENQKNFQIDIKAVLDRLKSELNLSEDSELAEIMGVPIKTVGAWKRRGTIPIQKITELCMQRNLNLHSVLTGEQPKAPPVYSGVSQQPAHFSMFPELESVFKEADNIWNRIDQSKRFELAAKMLRTLKPNQ